VLRSNTPIDWGERPTSITPVALHDDKSLQQTMTAASTVTNTATVLDSDTEDEEVRYGREDLPADGTIQYHTDDAEFANEVLEQY